MVVYNMPIPKMIQRYKMLYSALVYDVLEEMGYPDQTLSLSIRPLDRNMVLAGTAFTMVGTREAKKDNDEVRGIVFSMLERIYENSVIVINAEGNTITGNWGELLSTAARAKGAVGAVIDGGTRDSRIILTLSDWAIFSRFTSPIESDGRWQLKECEIPIIMSGTTKSMVTVRPGDWIFGDMDAVIVVPMEVAEQVMIRAEEMRKTEDAVREELKSGASFKDVWDKYERL